MSCIPNDILARSNIWFSMVPLINYATVEWHPGDRVLRKFGFKQGIPDSPPVLDSLHDLTRQGNTDVDWSDRHKEYIQMWAERLQRVPMCEPIMDESLGYGY